MGLVISVLDEVEETLAGLAGPGGGWVGNLWLLATEVVAEVLGRDGLFAEPEVPAGELEAPAIQSAHVQDQHVLIRLTSADLGPCIRACRR